MNTEILKQKFEDADRRFNKTKVEIGEIEANEQTLAKAKAEKNIELFRIQGEARILKALLGEDSKNDVPQGKTN